MRPYFNTIKARKVLLKIFLGFLFVLSSMYQADSQLIYDNPGTYQWTVPPCVYEVTVQVYGAGGGGGGAIGIMRSSIDSEACSGAGGGGGGGFTSKTFPVTPGQTYTVDVGAGGILGASGAGTWNGGISTPAGTGGVGGTSSFVGYGQNLVATGGDGGTGGSAYNNNNLNDVNGTGNGGNGGVGSGGTSNYSGGSGANGLMLNFSTDKSGGGGGAAGPGGNGGDAEDPVTNGVAEPNGGVGQTPGGNGGNGRMQNQPFNVTYNGNNGSSYGGGGSGGLVHRESYGVQQATGGAGADGAVLIYFDGGDAPDEPVVSVTSSTCSAAGTATVTNYDGSYTYSSEPSGLSIDPATGNISGMTPGTTYTIKASNGECEAESEEFSIQAQLPKPDAPDANNQTFCEASTVGDLAPSGAGYNWYNSPTSTTPLDAGSPLIDGTYYVSITVDGCESDRTPITVSFEEEIEVDYEVGECTEGKYDITGTISTEATPETGNLVVKDCSGNEIIIASAPFTATSFPFALENLTADGGDCTLEVYFSEANCPKEINFTAPEPCEDCTPPEIDVNELTICAGNAVDLNTAITNVEGDVTYTFHSSEADAENGTNAINNSVSTTGTYWVRGEKQSEDGDCYDVQEIKVVVIEVTYDVTIVKENCGQEDGSITLTADGGQGTYTYSIDNGATTQNNGSFGGLEADSYTILIVDDESGCEVTGVESVGSIGGPEITSIPVNNTSCPEICDGTAEVILDNPNGNYTYTWKDASGAVIVGQEDVEIENLCAGSYSITVTDEDGCKSIETFVITAPAEGTFDVEGVDPSCGNMDGQIIISGLVSNGNYDVSYSNNGTQVGPIGKQSNGSGEIIIDHLGAGNYGDFEVQMDGGCAMSSDEEITLINPNGPEVQAPADMTICLGESVTLTASNPGGATISWSDNIANGQSFIPDSEGMHTYTVTATIDDCSVTDEVNVFVESAPNPDFVADKLMGCEPLTVNFENLTTGDAVNCLWTFGDGTTSNSCGNVTHTYSHSGVYTVTLTVESSNGCSAKEVKTNYIHVTSPPIADFSATPQTTNINNTEVQFINNTINGSEYTWDFGDNSILDYTVNPSHTYSGDEPNSYVVTLIASNGENCADTARLIIKVEDVLIFYVPNTFTPDNDTYNEVFSPVFTSGYDPYHYTLLIFDRWGELIFESHDTTVGWDGTYGGKIVKDGTYVWKIEFKETMSDKHHRYVGHVTLLR